MIKERPVMEFFGLTILNFSKLELLASVFLIGYYIWYYWGTLSEGPYITEALVKITFIGKLLAHLLLLAVIQLINL